jgi:hypothetical protein
VNTQLPDYVQNAWLLTKGLAACEGGQKDIDAFL